MPRQVRREPVRRLAKKPSAVPGRVGENSVYGEGDEQREEEPAQIILLEILRRHVLGEVADGKPRWLAVVVVVARAFDH
jgi:hypothetical protein